MVFLVHQLDNLDYDQAEPLLEDYLEGALEDFVQSKAGRAHIKRYPEGGAWIELFIEMAFLYGGYTLPKMTKGDAQAVMEDILPRRLVLSDPNETDDAIPELVAFWTYLDEVYRFRNAKAIAKYLNSIADQFPQWMFDPQRGGMAKHLLMDGMAKGFDMTTPEGIKAFQASQNAQTQNPKAQNPKAQNPKAQNPKAHNSSEVMLPPMPAMATMTTPPADMQAAFERLGLDLPPVGAPVNLMTLMEQFLAGVERLDSEEAEDFIQSLRDSAPAALDIDAEPSPPRRRGTMADLRAELLHSHLAEAQPISATDQQVLRDQTITATSPGTILQDLQRLLDLAASDGIPVSGQLQHVSLKVLPDLNQRLSQPLTIDMKRPQQKSYPNLHGLYLLLRATGLTTVVAQGKQRAMVVNPDIYTVWQELNPTEQYLSLLEVWFLRSHPEMLGEERQGPSLVGDRCLQSWHTLAKKASLSVPNYALQYNFAHYPGLYNLALMEMFGLIAITHGKPEPGKGWRFKKIQCQPWGKALMALLHQAYRAVDYEWPGMLDPLRPLGDLQPVLQPYFPEWQRCLSVPSPTFQSGRYIFKVSLGKVWRRMAIPAEATLDTFSYAILDAVDFDSDHLYQFTYKSPTGRSINACHPYMEDADLLATEVRIGDLPLVVGETMEYLFDFGDCWEFQLELEAIEPIPAEPAQGFQKAKTKASQSKPPKLKVEILESHGKAPEQYPDVEDW